MAETYVLTGYWIDGYTTDEDVELPAVRKLTGIRSGHGAPHDRRDNTQRKLTRINRQ